MTKAPSEVVGSSKLSEATSVSVSGREVLYNPDPNLTNIFFFKLLHIVV